ncbi:PTTG1 protein, partial [Toxostoma redivivum]|nr:PTTG1 protein [Toxostoma redivivum]
MATLIFVDQENGELCAPKSQLKFSSGSSKVLAERTQVNTLLPKKGISTSPLTSRSVRKALGNVNKTEGVMNKMDKIKQKNQPCTVNKVIAQIMLLPLFMTNKKTGLESCHTVAEEDWPEIENMFPLVDPQDFESFDLPEEHKLSNINLCGVPLMVFERTYDRCVKMVPSPVKTEEISWESNLLQSTVDFLATLDDIIDMPPPIYD